MDSASHGGPAGHPAVDSAAHGGPAGHPTPDSPAHGGRAGHPTPDSASHGGPAGHPAVDSPARATAMDASGTPASPGGSARPGRKRRADAPRFAKVPTTGSIIGWTLLSTIVPGAAHLRAGQRRAGFILLGVFGAVLLAGVIFGVVIGANLGLAVKDSTWVSIVIAATIGALAWFSLVITSYIALGPDRLPQAGQVISGVVVGVLCVSVMAPFALTATSMMTVRTTTNEIFQPEPGTSVAPVKQEDPWNGRHRVNFLLVGGDAAGNRAGVRTDSMTVASVDVRTGNSVMFSLPRNLQFVRFPKGDPLAARFPNGFTGDSGQGLLNEVWQYAEDHLGKGRGPRELKSAIGYTLGLRVDYYAIVDMYGFAALIDAIGGLKIRVERDIRWGGHFGTAGTIKAGYQRLDGEHVLWYGRSRVDSDDFSRMSRQRCVMGALLNQATPSVVLANFGKIATATRHLFRTDIPRDLLEHLVPLALKVKDAKTTSLQFVPPTVWPGAADWVKIRRLALQAIRESERSSGAGSLAAGATPSGSLDASSASSASSPGSPASSPSGGGSSATPAPSRSATASTPVRTPTPNRQSRAAAKTLQEACGF
ncbi:LCP family protein [Sphaerisporangium dianthi]|uniref:LCP family protein n=1 Tax=Sphaerisporangium dianthi TaxID=1436120 RepID=A0ABV9CCA5_9ACTN